MILREFALTPIGALRLRSGLDEGGLWRLGVGITSRMFRWLMTLTPAVWAKSAGAPKLKSRKALIGRRGIIL